MRSYPAGSLSVPRRGQGFSAWRLGLSGLGLGFFLGFISAYLLTQRKPIEFTIDYSTPEVSLSAEDKLPPSNPTRQDLPELWSVSGEISVRIPAPQAFIKTPLIVEGLARTFENNVQLRLSDSSGKELTHTFTEAHAPDLGLHGPYRVELRFDLPTTTTGVLEVFELSAENGQEINKVTVPVRFK